MSVLVLNVILCWVSGLGKQILSKSDAKSSRYERNFIHPHLEIIVKLQFNIEPLHREIASEVFAARKYWLFKLSESLCWKV